MILQLANNIELDLVEYNTENSSDLKFVVRGETIETIKNKFVTENLKTVTVIDLLKRDEYTKITDEGMIDVPATEERQIIAEFYDRALGKEITLNIEVDQITIHLVEHTLTDKVKDLSDQLTQAQADIAYISVLSDIDTTTEEETSNESSI